MDNDGGKVLVVTVVTGGRSHWLRGNTNNNGPEKYTARGKKEESVEGNGLVGRGGGGTSERLEEGATSYTRLYRPRP